MKQGTLARIHRVRTLQLGLARAEESRHRDTLASEAALKARIAGLVEAIAPAPEAAGARSLAAAAHYRERLQQSADAAVARVRVAEQRTVAAEDATRAAKRDQTAVEKLLARARTEAGMREMRALADAPVTAKGKRHDPC